MAKLVVKRGLSDVLKSAAKDVVKSALKDDEKETKLVIEKEDAKRKQDEDISTWKFLKNKVKARVNKWLDWMLPTHMLIWWIQIGVVFKSIALVIRRVHPQGSANSAVEEPVDPEPDTRWRCVYVLGSVCPVTGVLNRL